MDANISSMARAKLDNLLQLVEESPIDKPYIDLTAVLIAQFLREIADSLYSAPAHIPDPIHHLSPEEMEEKRATADKDNRKAFGVGLVKELGE